MSRRRSDPYSDHGDDTSYSLDELTSLADVTTRTVRYYIAEGLLPPPATIGRNASYRTNTSPSRRSGPGCKQ
jgi:hypothetical protein